MISFLRLTFIIGLLTLGVAATTGADTTTFHILQTTDTHAYQYGHSFLGLDATFSNYISFVNQFTAKHPHTLVLDSGDITQGTAVSAFVYPAGSAPLENFFKVPNIMSTVGNHDLNEAAAKYIKYVSHISPSPWTDRMVTSNIRLLDDISSPMGTNLWTTRTINGLTAVIIGNIYTQINGDRTFKAGSPLDDKCYDVTEDGVYVLWPNQTFLDAPISYTYTDASGTKHEVNYKSTDNEATDFAKFIAATKPDLIIGLMHIPTFYQKQGIPDVPIHPDMVRNIQALRQVPGVKDLPLVFLTGHSHIWDQSPCKWTNSTGKYEDDNCFMWNGDKYDQVFGIINITLAKESDHYTLQNPATSRTRVNTSITEMEAILGEKLVCDEECQILNITLAAQVAQVDAWKYYGYLPEEWPQVTPYGNPKSVYNLWLKYFGPKVLGGNLTMINRGNLRRTAYKGNNYFEDMVELYPFSDLVTQVSGMTPEAIYYMIMKELPPAVQEPKDYKFNTELLAGNGYFSSPAPNELEAGKHYTLVYDHYDSGNAMDACEKAGAMCVRTVLTNSTGQPREIRSEFYEWFHETYGKNATHPTDLISSSLPTYTASTKTASKANTKTLVTDSSNSKKYAHMTKGDIAATVIVLSIVLACIGFGFGCCLGKKKSAKSLA